MTIPKPTFRDLILLMAIAILAVVLFRGCGADKSYQQRLAAAEKLRKQSVDSAYRLGLDSIQKLNSNISVLVDRNDSLVGEVEVIKYERNQAWASLGINKAEVAELKKRVRETGGTDSSDCLELVNVVEKAEAKLVTYEQKNTELIKAMELLGVTKDSIIKFKDKVAATALGTNAYLKKQYDSLYHSFKKMSPSASFSGGFTVMGSKVNPLSGAGIAGLFTQKNGNSIGVNALMLRDSELYFQGTYLWRFSLRKKK